MKPVNQSIYGDKADDFRACVATILELPLEEVPNFDCRNKEFFGEIIKFVSKYDLMPIFVPAVECIVPHDVPFIATGTTSMRTERSVVMLKGRREWDPWGEGPKIIVLNSYIFFLAANPVAPLIQ